jgi:Arc/MetJ-type ribon-helix-helix transcriptional regulator
MEFTLTKPIEEFIRWQIAKGYADADEVARQAFLRWMEEENFEPAPPRLVEKLTAARKGTFRSYNPEALDSLISQPDESPR